jgi:uncharacterized protein involved in high-affinity Fe2+ transport
MHTRLRAADDNRRGNPIHLTPPSTFRVALVAIAGMLLALLPATAASAQSTFSDVSDDSVHYPAIDALADAGVTEGCAPDRFCPTEVVPRDQMAAFLVRALDLSPTDTDYFSDDSDSYHEDDINALAAAGYTEGCADGRYCPHRPVSRQEVASFLQRSLGLSNASTTWFFDVGGTHADAVQSLGEAGISNGCDPLGLRFCPTQGLERAQMASVLARALDHISRVSIPTYLEPGDSGRAVAGLQRELARLDYWVGPIDGVYGTNTERAVLAFQKAHGLARDGLYGGNTRANLGNPSTPSTATSSGTFWEFDEGRQLLMLVRDGDPQYIFHASGGNEEYYTYDGQTYWAETPNGHWDVYRQIDGWRESHLGELFRPKYFHTDGIAFHGYTSVPAYAASHGCIRVGMDQIDWIWASGTMPIGANVYVYGSPG